MSDRKILFTPKKSIIARGNDNRRLTFYAIIDIGGFQMSEHDEDEDETTKRRASFRPPLLGFVLTSFISPEQASPSRSSRSLVLCFTLRP